jgi:hypothetical protein
MGCFPHARLGDCLDNPVAGISKAAGNVKSPLLSLAHRMGEGGRRPGEGMNWDLGEGERQDHFCPVQKIFAPLRLCDFAS